MPKLFYHWTLELPFDVLLVHNVAYETEEIAREKLADLPEVYEDFTLLRDDQIASIETAFIISVPLKRD
jgi:hypothetical protein